jgi:hypothetical protein
MSKNLDHPEREPKFGVEGCGFAKPSSFDRLRMTIVSLFLFRLCRVRELPWRSIAALRPLLKRALLLLKVCLA